MLERVIEIIQEQLNLEGVEITEESSFKDDLGADSLDAVEIVMDIEDEFGVEIDDTKAEAISTVGDLVSYIEELKK